ncbi:protein kinase domain-containing protein [Nannocystaceae bacterium ST9]
MRDRDIATSEPLDGADEAGPQATGDPMASIRPPLPSAPPLRAPTVELGAFDTGPTRTNSPGRGTDLGPATLLPVLDTHDGGPFVIPVREPDCERDDDDDSAYVLCDLIGEGGMGEVWQARQRSLGRIVALKRLRRGTDAPQSIVRQFESEARLTGVLDHPNIVTVHELGRDQLGRVFYTMKRIVGTPWSQLIDEGVRIDREGARIKLELRDHLEILLEVANAIAFAHSRGVIHRDIKPGNVMIGDYGEVQVVDWGLAVALRPLALLGGAETWTIANLPRNALTCGTPAYMSPETASAEREQISPATDVYLLGAVLFHVLYGRPPHRGRTVAEVIDAARRNAWTLPERVTSKLRPWHALLRPILVRALAGDPGARFPDASGFAEALREALRNYDSAKLASSAADQLGGLDLAACTAFIGYQELAKIVARFEEALQDWSGNFVARRGLAQAHLTLAEFALGHRDIGFAEAHLDAFENMPEPPDAVIESMGLREDSRALPLAEHTLVGAPQPADTMVASAGAEPPGMDSLEPEPEPTRVRRVDASLVMAGAMFGAPAELLARLASTDPQGTRARSSAGMRRHVGSGPVAGIPAALSSTTLSGPHSAASLSLEPLERDQLLAVQHEQLSWAVSLRTELRERVLITERRRKTIKGLWALAVALGVGLLTVLVIAGAYVVHERDRTEAERNRLAKELLEETSATTKAELEGLFEPVHGVLIAAAGWAGLGLLDDDAPEQLNELFMPVLEGIEVSTSMLRADAEGHEYMLLRTETGWRTRTSAPERTPVLRDWNRERRLIGVSEGDPAYDPHRRPWYIGGAALRERAEQARREDSPPPVHWTAPYIFFTTKEPGISVSTPAPSPTGRQFVIAFDIKLADISEFTEQLPRNIAQGQVFVLSDDERLLGLPREAITRPEDRRELILEPLGEIGERVPRSHQAWREWVERGRSEEPFRIARGEDEVYWVDFHRIEQPGLPHMWIGVVLPESHFVE